MQKTLLAINRLDTAGYKQIKYMGESNIERLTSFFLPNQAISSEEQLLELEMGTPEVISATSTGRNGVIGSILFYVLPLTELNAAHPVKAYLAS